MRIQLLSTKSITNRATRLVSSIRNNHAICLFLLIVLLILYIDAASIGIWRTLLGETLRELDEVKVKKDSIFFVETSGSGDINPRQACSVESAARANPNTQVYGLIISPIIIHENHIIGLLRNAYPNVAFYRLNPVTHSKGTLMEKWFRESPRHLNSSLYPVQHFSDAIRYLLLLKHGGTYLDLDVIVLKSLEGIRNVAGAEDSETIGNSVINIEGPGGRGHALAKKMAKDFVSNFDGSMWSHNGPEVITRVLDKLCRKIERSEEVVWLSCPYGFRVLPPSTFFPIHWSEWESYFNESNVEDTMAIIEKGIVAHIWNQLSSGTNVRPGSRQPYGLLAAKYCPVVYRYTGGYM